MTVLAIWSIIVFVVLLFAMMIPEERESEKIGCPCGWKGTIYDLVNPNALGEDYFIDGECCPKCGEQVL